jgi:Trk K+ transport system NAD-binding subunit
MSTSCSRAVGGVRPAPTLVLDDEGGFLAPTAAERLVAEGFAVEIATTHPVVGAEIDLTQQPFVFRRLELAGVVMTPHLCGVSSDADGVTLRNLYTEREERREGVGLVVMAGYRQADIDLRHELTASRPELRVVVAGDALAPRTLLDAVAEGARAGASV